MKFTHTPAAAATRARAPLSCRAPYNAKGEDLAAASSLVYSNYGTPLGTLENLYGDRPWEIHVVGRYGPHLGSFRVGDKIGLSLSVGPIGEKTYARSKRFGKGQSDSFAPSWDPILGRHSWAGRGSPR